MTARSLVSRSISGARFTQPKLVALVLALGLLVTALSGSARNAEASSFTTPANLRATRLGAGWAQFDWSRPTSVIPHHYVLTADSVPSGYVAGGANTRYFWLGRTGYHCFTVTAYNQYGAILGAPASVCASL